METEEIEIKWNNLLLEVKELIGKKILNINNLLFLIGVQELGKGPQNFSKEQKQDLIHVAVCKILSADGYYKFEKLDEQGWPHYTLGKPIPFNDVLGQENFLKKYIIQYFENEILIKK